MKRRPRHTPPSTSIAAVAADPAATHARQSDIPAPDSRDHHAAMQQGFRWQVDEFFNIAEVCCSRWARAENSPARASGANNAARKNAPERIAIKVHATGAGGQFHTYLELKRAADALSHVLVSLGVQRGDRVAIVMPQRFETAVAYMAVLQMGAVAMRQALA